MLRMTLLLFIGVLAWMVVGCAAPAEETLPTLAVLPSLTPSVTPAETQPVSEGSPLPATPTVSSVSGEPTRTPLADAATTTPTLIAATELSLWYSNNPLPVHECPATTCAVLTNFPPGVQLLVVLTENGWHEIQLGQQRGRYVEARLTTQSTPVPTLNNSVVNATSLPGVVNPTGATMDGAQFGQSQPPTSVPGEPPPFLTPGAPVAGPTGTPPNEPLVTARPDVTITLPFQVSATPPGSVATATLSGPPGIINPVIATNVIGGLTFIPPTVASPTPNLPPGFIAGPTATPFLPQPPGS